MAAIKGSTSFAEEIRIGLVQTSLNHLLAWKNGPKMTRLEEERAIFEIRSFIATFKQDKTVPEVILFPELAVPRGFEPKLREISRSLEVLIIAGMDYRHGGSAREPIVRNEAIVIIPPRWRGQRIGLNVSARYVGKTYPAPEELKKLKKLQYGWRGDPTVWIFDGGTAGRFAVAVCYDFMDLERIAMYRGQIHHLFVLAYNKDTTSFDHVGEALARMIFCNVVVCNCGFFGGSFSVSPYRRPERRTIYRHSGARLSTAQVIVLPVKTLDEHQKGNPPLDEEMASKTVPRFKSLPPGYKGQMKLKKKVKVVKP